VHRRCASRSGYRPQQRTAPYPLNLCQRILRSIGGARGADRGVNPAGGILVAIGQSREHCSCVVATAISSNPPGDVPVKKVLEGSAREPPRSTSKNFFHLHTSQARLRCYSNSSGIVPNAQSTSPGRCIWAGRTKGVPSGGRSSSFKRRIGTSATAISAGDERHHLSVQKRPEPAQAPDRPGCRPTSDDGEVADLAEGGEKKNSAVAGIGHLFCSPQAMSQ
jgi:hypothetical protein